MPPYRKVKRNYSKPFFSNRRRGLSGLPLLLFTLAIISATVGLLAFAFAARDDIDYAARGVLDLPRATPTLYPSQHAQGGITLYTEGSVEEALAELELAVMQRPRNIDYLYEYGRILIELDRFAQAVEIGDRAMAAVPDDPRGYALKARALMWSDPGAAIPLAVSGLERDANFAPLHAALAIAYTNIGRYSEGYQRGLLATQLDPLDSFSHRAFAIPLIYTDRRNQAIAALETAVSINPNLTAPYFELALQYRQQDYQEMAVGIYRRILQLEPNNAKAYLRICQTYAEVGEFLTATPFCETATELDENYADAWQWLGQMRYTRRNYEGTLEAMEKCVELGSTAVECYYMRGWSYYVLDQCPKAWDVLQEARLYTREPHIIGIIDDGLASVRANCPGYEDARLPTQIPPTPIPPTPIGGI
ncbi:MAG: tetratricopeptide repeat protein [Chloroflexi bacterium]|nr:tetratricopeptide repeat protein [Chloroflexota bacterium]